MCLATVFRTKAGRSARLEAVEYFDFAAREGITVDRFKLPEFFLMIISMPRNRIIAANGQAGEQPAMQCSSDDGCAGINLRLKSHESIFHKV